MKVMIPAIGNDQIVPAEDASVKLMPTDDPVPSQVHVRVKDSAPKLRVENCLGISLL